MATDEQVLMTLAALAPTAATALPHETGAAQATRIAAGVAKQLALPGLATAGEWELVWLALTGDGANLAYVAANAGTDELAVVLRGTTLSLIDALEDLDVGTLVPFPEGGDADALVATGAHRAFADVTSAVCQVEGMGLEGTTLLQALGKLVAAVPQGVRVAVTGHSLGGALATTVALYLAGAGVPVGVVWTFAAPTAGGTAFQEYYDATFGTAAHRTYNAYDIVPLAWSDLPQAKAWYPPPGPRATFSDQLIIDGLDLLRLGNVYVQPTGGPHPLNTDYDVRAPVTKATTFTAQVAFQHHATTYLTLLAAPQPPAWPVVTGLSATQGPVSGGNTVTVTGTGFAGGALVYFGENAATGVTVRSPTELAAVAPAGFAGHVDVLVTTYVGTSAPATAGMYEYR